MTIYLGFLVLGFLCGYVVGSVPWTRSRHAALTSTNDEALIVAYLKASGDSSALSIRLGMKDFTQGVEDWSGRDAETFQALRRLEASGAIVKTYKYGHYEYRLAVPDAVLSV